MANIIGERSKTIDFHIIQAKVRFGRIIQLIRNDPQKLYLSIKLFEFKPCDFNIQVHFFAFAVNLVIYQIKKNNR